MKIAWQHKSSGGSEDTFIYDRSRGDKQDVKIRMKKLFFLTRVRIFRIQYVQKL